MKIQIEYQGLKYQHENEKDQDLTCGGIESIIITCTTEFLKILNDKEQKIQTEKN